MFTAMLESVQHEVVRVLARVQIRAEEDVEAVDPGNRAQGQMNFQHAEAPSATRDQGSAGGAEQPFVREGRKVGRNEPCPCGSGKKFKQCHGALS
jgi:preprotein translocase subunit SecA